MVNWLLFAAAQTCGFSHVPPIIPHFLPNAAMGELEGVPPIAGSDGRHHRLQQPISHLYLLASACASSHPWLVSGTFVSLGVQVRFRYVAGGRWRCWPTPSAFCAVLSAAESSPAALSATTAGAAPRCCERKFRSLLIFKCTEGSTVVSLFGRNSSCPHPDPRATRPRTRPRRGCSPSSPSS